MAKIFLSVPVLDRPELNFMYSMYQAILSCRDHQVRVYFNANDSLISRVRNVHLSAFYNDFPECDYFMSLDSDLEIINCYPNNNIFSKLIAHDKEFVGGLYALKKQGVRRSSSITVDGKDPDFDQGLVEMKWLSTGCWCLKRSMVTKMIEAYPELLYDGDDNASGKKIYGLYIPMLYDLKENDFPTVKLPFKKYLSEDWSFAQRWKAIGGKLYADTSIALSHIGKFNYKLWDVEATKVNPNTSLRPNLPPPGFDLSKQ
jgi:hypothetical protein